ncbi:hypothetical protein CDL12_17233 [Handroanthus impetiginosus]|uniref:Aminotransferase-like plant mobile domain-containing protein n=1 Tax=Handroanthus impetiginosus TaxID=429701 RepID=A0A2G9GY22_9LAMI|nr:hypothetical protein CDL12_17233 [Handroanthus impetiginosus]
MVYFRDISPFPGSHQLIILDDKTQPIKEGTCLVLVNLLYLKEWSQEISLSKTSKAWILLAAHHQHSNELICFLPTLGRRIIQENARWRDVLQFAGEFQYIKGYWEWTEDVLSRCRHKLDAAQIYDSVYASLFTYNRNSEVMKAFFEAWLIPIFEELTGVDQTNNKFILRSCKYLFHAYHLLRKSAVGQFSRVSIEMWISLWSKKNVKYRQPPPRKEKKKTRPKSTHNSSGDFDVHQEWTTMEETPFFKLGLDRKLRDETYLAAYLASSMIATGRKVSLGIPVLASIYKGLNKVSNSPRPTRVSYPFPVHFVHAWLACYLKTYYSVPQDLRGPKMTQFSGEGGARYFDPKEARKRIHKGDSAHWTYNMITKNQNLLFVDDEKAKELEQNYFIAIRSNYLTLRQDKHFVVEPYSPHRFSQSHEVNKRTGVSHPIEESSTDRHWKRPKRDSKTSKQTEADGDETGSNQTQAFAKKLEMKIFSIDDDEESQDSQASSTKFNSYTPIAMKEKKLVLDTQKKFLQMLWDNLCRKISSTPIDSISSIHDEVQVVLTSMRNFDKFDISHLEERLKMLFDRAAVYDTARSASLNRASKEILARQMKDAKDHLHEARIKESKAKEELNNLEERKRNLLTLLDQQ